MKGTNSERKTEVRLSKVEGVLETRCCRIRSAEAEESKRVSASRRLGKSPSFVATQEEGARVQEERRKGGVS